LTQIATDRGKLAGVRGREATVELRLYSLHFRFRFCLTMANQHLDQIGEATLYAVFGNVGSKRGVDLFPVFFAQLVESVTR
jgi:hypothetical protein